LFSTGETTICDEEIRERGREGKKETPEKDQKLPESQEIWKLLHFRTTAV
jgi:hypothetical protein